MLTLQQYAPKCRAVCYTRDDRIDVTDDYLIELQVKRSLQKYSGSWDLLLLPKPYRGKTLDHWIRPQDYVELEIARVPSAGGTLVIALRGFVDNVRGAGSGVSRTITINGRDYGKLLLKFQIYYLSELDPTINLIPQARLEVDLDFPGGIITYSQFVHLVNDKIIKPNLAAFRSSTRVQDLRLGVDVPSKFALTSFSMQSFTGSVAALLEQYLSKPWLESFVDDAPDGPILHYRWSPLRAYDSGALIGPYAQTPPRYVISTTDIVSHDLGVSDSEVYNYFFTYPYYSFLQRNAFKASGIDLGRNPYLDQTKVSRYGFLPLEIATPMIPYLDAAVPVDPATPSPSTPTPPLTEIELASELNQWLVRAMGDNDRFENGTITIAGGGGVQLGSDLLVREWGKEYYITDYVTQYSVKAGQTKTTLSVVRGRPSRRSESPTDRIVQRRPAGGVIGLPS
jgi:hypothetical protein